MSLSNSSASVLICLKRISKSTIIRGRLKHVLKKDMISTPEIALVENDHRQMTARSVRTDVSVFEHGNVTEANREPRRQHTRHSAITTIRSGISR